MTYEEAEALVLALAGRFAKSKDARVKALAQELENALDASEAMASEFEE